MNIVIDPRLTKICVGNNFQQGYIISIISVTEIIFDNGKKFKFEDLKPIKLTAELLKEQGYSNDSTIHNHAKILVLENEKNIYGEILEPGIYLADLKNNIFSNRINYLHEFQNLYSMLIDYNMPFN